MYYGYRCYNKDREALGWLYTAVSEQELNAIAIENFLVWCKRWKTKRGAEKNFDYYNQRWQYKTEGGYLKIEVMPKLIDEDEPNGENSPPSSDKEESSWTIELDDADIIKWLNEERFDAESNQDVIMRKLRKLMNLENEGY